MKNIHVLPTDKPSRLYNNNGQLHLDSVLTTSNGHTINQNIYITSDEEIKVGDWVIQSNFEKTNTQLIQCITEFQVKLANDKDGSFTKKKIIITTDQDLINEGVQAINDDFLEWFVKNPTCEEVEIQCRYNFYIGQNLTHYKVIIPKEEPKQETLEETAKKYADHQLTGIVDKTSKFECINDFIAGAKWQQEQAKETQKLTMINALVEFSKAHFDIHTEEAILNITRRAESYYNETFKQQEQ